MSVNLRFKAFLTEKRLSGPVVYEKLGISRFEYSAWIHETRTIPVNKIIIILKSFPDLNARWLLCDEGDMFDLTNISADTSLGYTNTEKVDMVNKDRQSHENQINNYLDQIDSLNKQISILNDQLVLSAEISKSRADHNHTLQERIDDLKDIIRTKTEAIQDLNSQLQLLRDNKQKIS